MKDYRAENNPVSVERVSMQVIERLAAAEELDPIDLPPLLPVVDLEALDTFVESAPSDTTVSFPVTGYDVTVTGDGTVSLDSSPDS
jgi:hypothetical protein